MTNEELDEATLKEAKRRIFKNHPRAEVGMGNLIWGDVARLAARLARENWTPPEPEPVDPDVLAFRKWLVERRFGVNTASAYRLGDCDDTAEAYLAGARMAREQERERAKGLEAYVKLDEHGPHLWTRERARKVLAKYRGEA